MPSSEKPYFEYTIRDTTIATIGDLLNTATGSFISNVGQQGDTIHQIASKFVFYDGGTGVSNGDRVQSRYVTDENQHPNQQEYLSRTDFENFPIIFGTTVLIAFEWIDRDIITIFGDAVASVDSNAFTADALKRFYTNPQNIRTAESTKKTLGTYKEMFNHISVWVWAKAISSKFVNGQIQYDDVLLDITPYVSNLNTNVSKEGGTFSFTVDPIVAKFNDTKNEWEIDDATIKTFKNDEYVSQSSMHEQDRKGKPLQRKSFYFHQILQENDVVFIRFESLESEIDRVYPYTSNNRRKFQLSSSDIQFKTFDMIGLLDVQNQASNFANNEVSITVNGRDLMKLFIEDGVYFYPFDFIKGGIFANANSDDDRLQRFDGQLLSRFQFAYKKIDNILNFIINSLGTIKICSDTLFQSYQNQGNVNSNPSGDVINISDDDKRKYDRRTFKFDLTNTERQQISDANNKAFTAETNENLLSIKNSRAASGLVLSDDNKELEAENTILGIMEKALTDADNSGSVDEVDFPDSIISGDQPHLFVALDKARKPTAAALTCKQTLIKNFKSKKARDSKFSSAEGSQPVPLKGIWQIIKLIVDFTVQNRLVADSSIGNEHGSLINAIQKVCQEPFVEFFGDTYEDQYYLTVRKPPFDREGFINLLTGTTTSSQNPNQIVSHNPMIVDINDEDVLEEQLQYGAEAFSWYHLNPQGNFIGGDDMSFYYLRAIFLKEYADIFGSRPMDIVSNYIPYQPIVTGGKQLGEAYMIKQGIYDLQYMIQSNAYLPFVRRGQIVITNGNRKIKRGSLIRLVSTGEVGHVESVIHEASFNKNSIDRKTTIVVDRMMVEKFVTGQFIDDIAGGKQKVSYFDLIDTTIDQSVFNNPNSTVDSFNQQILSKWKVNVEVFNFFLQSRQFN